MSSDQVFVRPAVPADVRAIGALVQPYADERILLAKEWVGYYEAVQEFVVAQAPDGTVVGCGALHVMWQDLAEIRTLAVDPAYRGRRVGHALLDALVQRARDLGLRRLFCLTFEVDFFTAHGFHAIEGTPVTPDVYAELLRSHDDGVAEFLDLARVKPNTLGNTRMLIDLHASTAGSADDRSATGRAADARSATARSAAARSADDRSADDRQVDAREVDGSTDRHPTPAAEGRAEQPVQREA